MRIQALLTLCILATAALAGCADSGGEDTADADDDAHDHADHDHNETVDPGLNGTLLGNATLEADVLNGSAPLTVNFTLDAEGADENTTWSLDFGDGNATNGTGLPAQAAHVYNVTGNLTAVFEATAGNSTETAALNITIEAGIAEEPRALPDQTHFEFGPAVGCAWDIPTLADEDPTPCISQVAGPDQPAVDGHWQALDERYWGLTLTSTVDKGAGHGSSGATGDWPLYDSDCFFFGEDTGTVIGDANGGGGACEGTVPEGTQWLFVFPYATPAVEFIVDFHLEAE